VGELPRRPLAIRHIFTYYVKMKPTSSPQVITGLNALMTMAELLVMPAEELARAAARQLLRQPARRNATLRPGIDTPLWNALVAVVRTQLRRRGEKINLGRELGVPPQRIHEYFVARTAAPDAERTLALLIWLARRLPPDRRGKKVIFT
jgi:hypothetical protein